MYLEIIILSEVSQTTTNIIWYHLHVKFKKWYKWTYLQSRNRFTYLENNFKFIKREIKWLGLTCKHYYV